MGRFMGGWKGMEEKGAEKVEIKCRNCVFYYNVFGHCRRHSPNAPISSGHEDRIWPIVDAHHDWCGDFIPNPEKQE